MFPMKIISFPCQLKKKVCAPLFEDKLWSNIPKGLWRMESEIVKLSSWSQTECQYNCAIFMSPWQIRWAGYDEQIFMRAWECPLTLTKCEHREILFGVSYKLYVYWSISWQQRMKRLLYSMPRNKIIGEHTKTSTFRKHRKVIEVERSWKLYSCPESFQVNWSYVQLNEWVE